MKHFVRFIAATAAVVVSSACNSHDDVMRPCQLIPNPADHKVFVQHLEEAGIPFNVDQEGWVRCLSKDRNEVQKLGRHVLGIESEPEQVTAISASAADAPAIALALTQAKISFEYTPGNNGQTAIFRWQPAQHESAIKLVEQIVD